jgi:hypothetical protein
MGQKYELVITASGVVTSTNGEPVPDQIDTTEEQS